MNAKKKPAIATEATVTLTAVPTEQMISLPKLDIRTAEASA